jgi:hypothetical protein
MKILDGETCIKYVGQETASKTEKDIGGQRGWIFGKLVVNFGGGWN